MTNLEFLKNTAAAYGAIIETDHVIDPEDCLHQGYWLLDAKTREGIWDDGNFASSIEELEDMVFDLTPTDIMALGGELGERSCGGAVCLK